MSLNDIRQALKTAIKTGRPEFNVYPSLRSVLQVPCVVFSPSTDHGADYYVDHGRSVTWYLDCFVLVPYTEVESNQRLLDDMISPDVAASVPALLDSRFADDLAEVIEYVKVKDLKGYGGHYDAAEVDHIGAVLKLEVNTRCA